MFSRNRIVFLFIYLFIVLTGIQEVSASEPAAFDAGAINSHDLNLIKQKQQIEKEKSDFIEVKDKKQKSEEIIKSEQPAAPVPVIKATVEEYETKGVYIDNVEFTNSEILSNDELYQFKSKLTGRNLFINDINAVVNEINSLYCEKGYVTAKAVLPEQTIESGILKIQLIEGKVGEISVTGNKWTRKGYIDKRLAGVREGDLFNIPALEKDILGFNRYTEGVKLNADLTPGKEFGTTDVNIKTEETLPFHITGTFDNAGRPEIGELRGGVMVADDSLFGFRDKFTSGVYLSRSCVTPFADYNIPINKYDGRIGFGFSSSHADVTKGDYVIFDLASRSFTYSLYYTQPLIRKPSFELNGFSSLIYKQATTTQQNDISTDKISSLQVGLNARYDTKKGIWYFSQSAYQAFPIFSDNSKYFKYEGSFARLHDFGHSIVGQLRGIYQWVPQNDVPFIDQFQAGGISTVRGNSEGILIGKTGYVFSAELLFPFLPNSIKVKDKEISFLGKYIKAIAFVDHAGVFPFKGEGPGDEGITNDDYLITLGPGLQVNLPGEITARLYWGFPAFTNSHELRRHIARFHFELTLSPDFDKLLEMRKTNNVAL